MITQTGNTWHPFNKGCFCVIMRYKEVLVMRRYTRGPITYELRKIDIDPYGGTTTPTTDLGVVSPMKKRIAQINWNTNTSNRSMRVSRY